MTFGHSEAKPEEMLYVSVPKLNKHEVLVPAHWPFAFTSTFLEGMPATFWFRTFGRCSLTG